MKYLISYYNEDEKLIVFFNLENDKHTSFKINEYVMIGDILEGIEEYNISPIIFEDIDFMNEIATQIKEWLWKKIFR
ncbi:MAG: hypothetical protein ACRCUP_01315 [Mycoplasmatales bacterium]